MELGIGLPTYGETAGPEVIGQAAQEAERLGLGSVWTGERLLRPAEPMMLGVGPMPLPDTNASVYDPLETLSFVAGQTSRVKLGTSVLDTLFQSPLVLARRLSTLDQLSGGRLIAGLGQGWMEQEFIATGVPVARRGAGFVEHIEAMRSVWGPNPVSFAGQFHQIPEGETGPKPVNPGGPVLLAGAGAPAAIERAARMGLGLTTVFFGWDALIGTVQMFRAAAGDAKLPVVVHINGAVTTAAVEDRTPLTGSVDQVAPELAQLNELGVDHVFWLSPETEPDDLLEGLGALQARQ